LEWLGSFGNALAWGALQRGFLLATFYFHSTGHPGGGEFRNPRTDIEVARVRSCVSALRERTFMLRIEMLHQ